MAIYEWVHDVLGTCFWTLPAIIVLIVCVVMFIVHAVKQKNRDKDIESTDTGSNASTSIQ